MTRKPFKIVLDADKLHRTKLAKPQELNFKSNPSQVEIQDHVDHEKTINRNLEKTFNDEFLGFLDSLGGK